MIAGSQEDLQQLFDQAWSYFEAVGWARLPVVLSTSDEDLKVMCLAAALQRAHDHAQGRYHMRERVGEVGERFGLVVPKFTLPGLSVDGLWDPVGGTR